MWRVWCAAWHKQRWPRASLLKRMHIKRSNCVPLPHPPPLLLFSGGIGAFVAGHQWADECHTYQKVDTPQEEADAYVAYTQQILIFNRILTSASIYTQSEWRPPPPCWQTWRPGAQSDLDAPPDAEHPH